MDLDRRLEAYYDALRDEKPLEPFFVDDPVPVKFGITEALHGYDEIADGLRAQTRTTTDWGIESHRLQTDHVGEVGWFSDHVTMRWRDRESDERVEWETRWSGTLLREAGEWRFVRMHVSAVPDA